MKQLMMAATMAGALACAAADQTLTYTAADKPATLGTGDELAFTYDGDTVTKIVANIAKGDTVYLKGDTLAFGTDATIETAGLGDLVISNALSGTSGLLITNTSPAQLTAEWWGDDLLDTNAWTTVFENVDLYDIELVSSDNNSWNAIHKVSGFSNPQLMYPYWVRTNTVNGVKTMTAQLQCWIVPKTGSSMVKYVGIELKQDGANVAARATTAAYIPTNSAFNATYVNTSVYRDDFEALRARWNADPDAAVNPRFYETPVKFPGSTSYGYGVGQLTVRRRDVPSVGLNYTANRTLSIGGDLKIAANARAKRLRTNSYNPVSGDTTSSIDVEGLWEIGDYIGSQGVPIKGSGIVGVMAETLPHENPYEGRIKNFLTYRTNHVDTATNNGNLTLTHSIFDLTNVCPAGIWGQSAPLKAPPMCIATPHHWRFYTNGPLSYATVQMQGSNSTTMIRCTILKFMQNVPDSFYFSVCAITNLACYTPLEKDAYPKGTAQGYFGMDFETETDTVGYYDKYGPNKQGATDKASPFSVSNLVCQFSRPGEYSMTLNVTNVNWQNGRLVVEGKPDGTRIFANVNGGNRLPQNGIVEIREGGTLNMGNSVGAPGTSSQNNSVQIRVHRGGVLRTYPSVLTSGSKWAYMRGQRIDLLGGEMMPSWMHYPQSENCYCYLNNTIFADGGRVTSDIMFWAGNAGSSEPGRWLVRGTSPSCVDSPVQFLGTGTTGWFEFKIDVADVAEGTDFFMTKPITRYSSTSLTNIRIGKYGPGTMEIQDTIDVIKGVYIYGGAFKLAGSHLTDASAQKFALSGGTLEAADGTTNSCGSLAITARGGGISLGTGATLTFADSSAETWAMTNKVVVTGFAEGAIRFGTSKAAAPRPRQFVTDDGRSLRVRDDGYLTADLPGAMILIR